MEEGQKENVLMKEGQKENYCIYGGRIKENYLWRKDRRRILMEEGQKENYLWKTMPSFFESYNLTVEEICGNCSLIRQLARWNNLEKN